MRVNELFDKALSNEMLSQEEGLFLYENADISDLVFVANEIRKQLHPTNEVGWIIDRNVNTTNVCVSHCLFCNFHCKKGAAHAYVTDMLQYQQKIEELFAKGGDQVLLQGGMNPQLDVDYYCELFKKLKAYKPELKLHALGPPEIAYFAKKENLSYEYVLKRLMESGLDSLPGAGAEILSDRVRKKIAPGKCTSGEWLDVMRVAHRLNLPTSATMMFGHIEHKKEIIEHLIAIRNIQNEKPQHAYGFITFVPWPFQGKGTKLLKKYPEIKQTNAIDYIRLISMSRILLTNIRNIQASWLTVGKETAQICLHAGANDMGSIMIEENVVSSAGAAYQMNAKQIQTAIREAGFCPRRRNQKYETV